MSTQPLTPAVPSISVIVPVCGRRSELRPLYAQYKAGIAAVGLPFEFIFVIDGHRTDAGLVLRVERAQLRTAPADGHDH